MRSSRIGTSSGRTRRPGKVWSYPTSFWLGFSRAVTIEELDPLPVASVQESGQIKQRTPLRYDRTLQYFATVIFGDAESVLKASEILVKVHSRAIGTDPVTGRRYDANDPESQLWIHLTAWHSILYTYERFGPGKLSAEEESRYWRECAIAAEFQTIDPERVPRSREGVPQYFEDYRPQLVGSELARDMFQFLANMELHSIPHSVPYAIRWTINAFISRAVISTFPRWTRDLGGTPQSRVTDAVVTAATKPVVRVANWSPRVKLAVIGFLSPRTRPVLTPVFRDIDPVEKVVYTPAEARGKFGFDTIPAQWAALTAKTKAKAYEHNHHDPILEFADAQAS
nr:oxygenase MpaB family protein [Flexivirga aerilata]